MEHVRTCSITVETYLAWVEYGRAHLFRSSTVETCKIRNINGKHKDLRPNFTPMKMEAEFYLYVNEKYLNCVLAILKKS